MDRIRDLIGWRDVALCALASVLIVSLFYGIPWVMAGGPSPAVAIEAVSVQSHAVTVSRATPPRVVTSYGQPRIVRQAVARVPISRWYKVKSGDTLSAISGRVYHSQQAWPVLYWGNNKTIKYANLIYPGQNLKIPVLPGRIPSPPSILSPQLSVSVVTTSSTTPTVAAPVGTPVVQGGTDYAVTSSFQACVIRAESGGQEQIWNASGHWGLYQFSYGTWVAAGGAGYLFGNSGGAYQTEIFWKAYDLWGTSPWAPYDGC